MTEVLFLAKGIQAPLLTLNSDKYNFLVGDLIDLNDFVAVQPENSYKKTFEDVKLIPTGKVIERNWVYDSDQNVFVLFVTVDFDKL